MTRTSLIDLKLAGRRALVTGAASGIGLATAERLARSGARVALNDIATDRLRAEIDRLNRNGLETYAVPGDLSNSATAGAVARESLERLDGIDFLVNNAGVPLTKAPIPAGDLEARTDEFWDRILRIDLLSAFWMTKALASGLRTSRGAVVDAVSIAALGGGGSSMAYATAKSGHAGLTRELDLRIDTAARARWLDGFQGYGRSVVAQ